MTVTTEEAIDIISARRKRIEELAEELERLVNEDAQDSPAPDEEEEGRQLFFEGDHLEAFEGWCCQVLGWHPDIEFSFFCPSKYEEAIDKAGWPIGS